MLCESNSDTPEVSNTDTKNIDAGAQHCLSVHLPPIVGYGRRQLERKFDTFILVSRNNLLQQGLYSPGDLADLAAE
jgi:hypothetical protein